MCVCERDYGSVGEAVDSGVWFSRQPVPTQGQIQAGREHKTAADRQSCNTHVLPSVHVLKTFDFF